MREKFNINKIGKMVGKFPVKGAANKLVDVIKSFLP
jgi:hypothetical protein